MGLALYAEHALERVDVKMGLGQQLLELGVLGLQVAQPRGIDASMPPNLERHL